MKKIAFLAVISMLVICNANAQFLKLGVKGGANAVKVSGISFEDKFDLGYYAGAFMELKLTKKVYLQPELLFSESNLRTSKEFKDVYQNIIKLDSLKKMKLSQLNIPITLNFKVAKVLSLQVGPQFSINMDKSATLLNNSKNALTNGDLSMVAGATLRLSNFRINARYIAGLNDINDIDDQSKWKSQSIQAGIGFVF